MFRYKFFVLTDDVHPEFRGPIQMRTNKRREVRSRFRKRRDEIKDIISRKVRDGVWKMGMRWDVYEYELVNGRWEKRDRFMFSREELEWNGFLW